METRIWARKTTRGTPITAKTALPLEFKASLADRETPSQASPRRRHRATFRGNRVWARAMFKAKARKYMALRFSLAVVTFCRCLHCPSTQKRIKAKFSSRHRLALRRKRAAKTAQLSERKARSQAQEEQPEPKTPPGRTPTPPAPRVSKLADRARSRTSSPPTTRRRLLPIPTCPRQPTPRRRPRHYLTSHSRSLRNSQAPSQACRKESGK